MAPRTRPVLVYDGDCGICTRCAEFADRHLARDAEIVAYQSADIPALGLTEQQCAEAVQWVRTDGGISSAHRAVADLLRESGPAWRPLGVVIGTPPLSWLAAVLYRWVARNRRRLPGGTPSCSIGSPSDGHRHR